MEAYLCTYTSVNLGEDDLKNTINLSSLESTYFRQAQGSG